jgi:hypothetical protein
MGSDAIIYIQRLVKIGSAIQMLMSDTQTYRQHGDRKSLFSFFKIRKAGFKYKEADCVPPNA